VSVDPQLIRRLPFFANLADPAVAALAAISMELRRPAGIYLFFEGDPASGIYLLLDGRVKISRTSAAGREQVLAIIGPGNHFNSVPTFDNGPCPADAFTLSNSLLLALPNEELREVALQFPEVALALLQECGSFLRRLVLLVDDLALNTVQGRLARLLLEQSASGQPMLTQAEMAARIGTVREMVGRTLRTFEALGIVQIERGTITIIDREALTAQVDV
jgi:CRP/FNR family transcriptional regulator, cyclic AMP receptor protein